MTTTDQDRRAAVHAWRWGEKRPPVWTVESLLRIWPEIKECEHPETDIRTLRNSHGVVVHVECKDCPKSAMRLIKPEELIWPGEEFWSLTGGSLQKLMND